MKIPPEAADSSTSIEAEEAHVRLGELLLGEGLLTPAQLEEALRVQSTPDRYAPLGHILIAQRIITRDQLLSVLERHRRSSKLGDILLKSREISRTQLEAALDEQRRTQQPLGEVLLRLGYISEERLRVALHDGLGQLLTSISFLASSLRQKLDDRQLPEASQAAEILSLTGRAISETQALVSEEEPE